MPNQFVLVKNTYGFFGPSSFDFGNVDYENSWNKFVILHSLRASQHGIVIRQDGAARFLIVEEVSIHASDAGHHAVGIAAIDHERRVVVALLHEVVRRVHRHALALAQLVQPLGVLRVPPRQGQARGSQTTTGESVWLVYGGV
jgi:hypothetical protein